MAKSIRRRLQTWYASVLLGVLVLFGAVLYHDNRTALFRQVEADLEAVGHYLDANLRSFPSIELEEPNLRIPKKMPPEGKDPPPKERLRNLLDLPSEMRWAIDTQRAVPIGFAIWRSDGSLLKSMDLTTEQIEAGQNRDPGERSLVMVRGETDYELWLHGPRRSRIYLQRSIEKEQSQLRAIRWRLLAIGSAVMGLGLLGGWMISQRIFRPVSRIIATAGSISEMNWKQRIDTTDVDIELSELAQVLNQTFDRLQSAYERQTRFTADASHELRTPLSILRMHAEVALDRPRKAEEYHKSFETCLRVTLRMSELVERMLTLARADSEPESLASSQQPIVWRTLISETIETLSPLWQSKSITIESSVADLITQADAVAMRQVITNLLHNAIQYNRPHGQIEITLQQEADQIHLRVRDTGCGIAAEDLPHLFERFYRVDRSRTRSTGGIGLGLAICQSLITSHGGTITCTSQPGIGTQFDVYLPAKPQEESEK